jgi:hypothetical protein
VKHSDEVREKALRFFDESGIWSAVAETGVHHTTIYRWHAERVRTSETNAEAVAEEQRVQELYRAHLTQRLMQVALAHVDRSDSAKSGKDAQSFATAAAIMLDKFRLEMGEHTGYERREVTPRQELEGRLDELAERRKRTA